MGEGGRRMAKYPGAALVTTIVGYAVERGRLPSEVYQEYLEHPRDYALIFGYQSWKAEMEETEINKAKKKQRT